MHVIYMQERLHYREQSMRNVIVHYAYQQLISTCCLSAGRCWAAPAEMLLRTKPLYVR